MTNNVTIKKTPRTARRWSWTLNNYTSEELEAIQKNTFRYLICGFETGEQGTPHLQGYLEVHQATTMLSLKRQPGFSRAHLEPSKGDRVTNREYCMKGEQSHAEYEELSTAGPNYGKNAEIIETGSWDKGGQGRRTDWHALHDFLKTTPDFSKAREEYPEECIKYTQGIRAVISDIKREKATLEMESEFKDIALYPWQQRILKDISFAPNKRTITWVVDTVGNRGKTWFAKYLLRYHGAAYLQNAKSADLAHAYNGERVVTFDYCRSNEEHINYQIIEQIKNGMVFSPKYDSVTKINAIPHVICFSNFEPNKAMLSMDRWDIRRLSNDDCIADIPIGTGNTSVPIKEEDAQEAFDYINALIQEDDCSTTTQQQVDNIAEDTKASGAVEPQKTTPYKIANARREKRAKRQIKHMLEQAIHAESIEKHLDPIYYLYKNSLTQSEANEIDLTNI